MPGFGYSDIGLNSSSRRADALEVTIATAVVCGIFGLLVGSFVNVVIWRVPRKESIVRPASHCPACSAAVRPYDNVPILSWALLRGRCRDCGERIPVRYPLVELACGVLWAGLGARFAGSWALPAFLVLGAGLLALSVIDLEHYLLPNRVVYPLGITCAALLGVAGIADGDPAVWLRALVAGTVAFVAFFVIHVVAPRGMGFGDVRLSFVLGLALGWLGWGYVALGLFLGFLYGAVIGAGLIATRLRSRRDHVPFGPFLAAGTLTAALWGQSILDWYLHR
jgi:leader peptidase (prepilin peptidase) / N-methyltransferase